MIWWLFTMIFHQVSSLKQKITSFYRNLILLGAKEYAQNLSSSTNQLNSTNIHKYKFYTKSKIKQQFPCVPSLICYCVYMLYKWDLIYSSNFLTITKFVMLAYLPVLCTDRCTHTKCIYSFFILTRLTVLILLFMFLLAITNVETNVGRK